MNERQVKLQISKLIEKLDEIDPTSGWIIRQLVFENFDFETAKSLLETNMPELNNSQSITSI